MTADADLLPVRYQPAVLRAAAIACLCLLLAGCPSASNPTQPQPPAPATPGTSSPPAPTTGTSGAAGDTAGPSDQAPGAASPADPGGNGGQPAAPDPAATGAADASAAPGGDTTGNGETGSGAAAPSDTASSGADTLPDMRDRPVMDAAVMAAIEAAMGAEGRGEGEAAGGSPTPGQETGTAASAATAGRSDSGAGTGPLTAAEQVAILDARLEASGGEFDALILDEQARQRSARRASTATTPEPEPIPEHAAGSGPFGEGISTARAGGAGGMGSVSSPGRAPPVDPPKYPPPADIPSGDDDDVVARQLREAAMREPDPAVRERLWDEYRKYRGISP